MKVKSQEKKSIQLEQEEFRKASITVTKHAVKRLKAVMKSEEKDNQYVRLSVESGGCSGMSYKMDFSSEKKEFESTHGSTTSN